MERLTKINGKYIEYSDENYNNSIDNRTMLEKCLRKLAEYEDAEEQGLLFRLPFKEGTTVYSIANNGEIYIVKATRELRIVNGVLHIICEGYSYSDLVSYDDVGKIVFLTLAEAKQKLKEMESESE